MFCISPHSGKQKWGETFRSRTKLSPFTLSMYSKSWRHAQPTSIREDSPEHDAVSLQHTVQCHSGRLSPCDDCLVWCYRNGSHILRRLTGHWRQRSDKCIQNLYFTVYFNRKGLFIEGWKTITIQFDDWAKYTDKLENIKEFFNPLRRFKAGEWSRSTLWQYRMFCVLCISLLQPLNWSNKFILK